MHITRPYSAVHVFREGKGIMIGIDHVFRHVGQEIYAVSLILQEVYQRNRPVLLPDTFSYPVVCLCDLISEIRCLAYEQFQYLLFT